MSNLFSINYKTTEHTLQMAQITEPVYSEIAEMRYNEKESMLYVKMIEDVVITVEKAKSHIKLINELTKNQNHYSLVDASNLFSIDDDALKYLATPEISSKKNAVAFYSTNLANRLTIHFFKLFHKPKCPVQLFRNKMEAISWLESYQKKVPVLLAVNQ